MHALNSVSKSDLSEIKAFKTPPRGILRVQQAVYILMNPNNYSGVKLRQSSENPVVLKRHMDFHILSKMINYDKDLITEDMLNLLEDFVNDPTLDEDSLRSLSSSTLCFMTWVRAMYNYGQINIALIIEKEALAKNQKQLMQYQTDILKLHNKLARLKKSYGKPENYHVELEQTIADHMEEMESQKSACAEKLQYLKKKDLTELRSMSKPPAIVIDICYVAFTLVGSLDEPIPDWSKVKSVLMNDKLLVQMLHFESKAVIPDEILKRIEPYLSDDTITVESASKVSIACSAFWSFVKMVTDAVLVHEPTIAKCKIDLERWNADPGLRDFNRLVGEETAGSVDVSNAILHAVETQDKWYGNEGKETQVNALDVLR